MEMGKDCTFYDSAYKHQMYGLIFGALPCRTTWFVCICSSKLWRLQGR